MSRSYPNIATDQTGQDYVALVFGDIVGPFVHRPGGPSQDAAGREGEVPATVAAVSLPNGAVDASVTNFIAQVTTTAIDAKNKLVGFQGDFTFDERVVTFQSEPVQNAGLTAGNWNVSGNVLPVLPGAGPIRTLRISAYSTDLTPLSGSGTLFELRMTAGEQGSPRHAIDLGGATEPVHLHRRRSQDAEAWLHSVWRRQFIGEAPVKPAAPKAAPARTIAPLCWMKKRRRRKKKKIREPGGAEFYSYYPSPRGNGERDKGGIHSDGGKNPKKTKKGNGKRGKKEKEKRERGKFLAYAK